MNSLLLSCVKRGVILLAFPLWTAVAQAQEFPTLAYLKNDGQQVAIKDSADYIRQVTGPNSNGLYDLLEQYPDGQNKRVGQVKGKDRSPLFVGKMINYYPNGNKVSELNYENSRLSGKAIYYYENGKPQKEINYLSSNDKRLGSNLIEEPVMIVESYYDTLGNQLVVAGSGYVKLPPDKDGDTEEGEYKDGQKDGTWKGTFLKKKYSFKENYRQGELLAGASSDSTGKQYPYTHIALKPAYPDGIQSLMKYVGKKYKYPREAVRHRIGGFVILSFVVDKIGKVTDVKILEDLGYGTGEEAVRVLKETKDWQPGIMRGVPVRVTYQLPISLQVGSKFY